MHVLDHIYKYICICILCMKDNAHINYTVTHTSAPKTEGSQVSKIKVDIYIF